MPDFVSIFSYHQYLVGMTFYTIHTQASNAKQKLSKSIDMGSRGLSVSGGRLSEACMAKAKHVADLLHVTLAALSSNDELVKAREVRTGCAGPLISCCISNKPELYSSGAHPSC